MVTFPSLTSMPGPVNSTVRAVRRRRVEPAGPPHRLTSGHLTLLQPPGGVAPDAGGALSGVDLHTREWLSTDEFRLYQAGIITSPHRAIIADLRSGKSAAEKTKMLRSRAYDRRVMVLDVKDEWGRFVETVRRCRHNVNPGDQCDRCPGGTSVGSGAKVTHVALAPGGRWRINPLDVPRGFSDDPDRHDTAGQTQARHAYRASVVQTIAAAGMGGRLDAVQENAVSQAIRQATVGRDTPTISDVVHALHHPTGTMIEGCGFADDPDGLRHVTRTVAASLSAYVDGAMAGMFDGATSDGIDPTDDVVVIALPDVFGDKQQAAVMAAIGGWLIGGLSHAANRRVNTFFDLEEAWALLRSPSTALFFTRMVKLASLWNVSVGWTIHKLLDLDAVGDVGSEEQALARNLIAETQSQMIGPQAPGQLGVTQATFGASDLEREAWGRLRRGQWIRRVGGYPSLIEHRRTPLEEWMTDTEKMG